ncbi:glycerol-3-phosphate dehydrogenase/oxidase [Thalassospira tepidiphila]|uniref:glycerol-3-phosphate dehydrogenase/oxidase n=1 Tax=Thalassospira tepidiphila TaxID=393657 RepID=UPI0029249FD3|nr:glycerol-3-phosphate dehydrogenase [Thalassospira tepidiphila]
MTQNSQDKVIPKQATVVVVGGGINGISVFRDLALQGVDVVLLEQRDFCSGASAALSRMVHGGLRYLENGEFRLVRQSLQERDFLLRNAPHYVFPLPTLVPIFDTVHGSLASLKRFVGLRSGPSRRSAIMIKIGLMLYDWLSRKSRTMPAHRFVSRKQLQTMAPDLSQDAKFGAIYYDAWVKYPERLGVEMILDTEKACPNASAHSYIGVEKVEGTELHWRDRLTGETGTITPDLVVNATGAWVDFTNLALSGGQENDTPRFVRGTKGSHLMIRNAKLASALGDQMVYYENADGRICIAFNYLGVSLVGSTDILIDDPELARCEESEKDYMLGALRFVFPEIEIARDDIVHVFTGVRPLPVSDADATGRISRDHSYREQETDEKRDFPVVSLIGGKWTTFRVFGEEIADVVLRRLGRKRVCDTRRLKIGGGRDFPNSESDLDDWIGVELIDLAVDRPTLERLAERYGSRARDIARFCQAEPDGPLVAAETYSRREIEFLIRNEKVRSLSDILLRRTGIGLEGWITPNLIEEIGTLMSGVLGWSAAELDHHTQLLREELGKKHSIV